MSRFNFTIALLALPLFIGGCAQQSDGQGGQDDTAHIETYSANGLRKSPDDLQLLVPTNPAPAHHDFAFADYQSNTPFDGNTLSAPFDLQQLLATVALGADGTTLEAVSAASKFDLNDVSTYAGISIWEQQVEALDGIERHRFMWGEQGYLFASIYLQAQAELFDPVMSGLDFVNDPFTSQSLVNESLAGQLSMGEIGDRTRLVAAQTTHLETGWAATSSIESVSGRFGPHDEQRWVDMVRVTGLFPTAVGDSYQAVEIPLADAGLSMVMITPASGQFDTVRQSLDATLWADIRDQLDVAAPATEHTIYVPKFALTREVTSDNMPGLGVALNKTAANFSRINNAGFLYLEVPRQHLSISVNEQGVNSSAITAAVHTATESEPPSLLEYGVTFTGGDGGVVFTILPDTLPCFYPPDQSPFLFVIYATANDTLLDIGQVRALDGPPVDADWTVPRFTANCGLAPPVEIYKYSGAKQCEAGSGMPLWDMEQELINAGIDVLESRQSNDGQIYIALCGSPDGSINVFTIDESAVPLAEPLGYSRLSELTP